MEKIDSMVRLMDKYGRFRPDATSAGMDVVGISPGCLNDGNFWKAREQCRINDGTYTPIFIDGDDKMRFLHVSVDDSAKVSYTKDADKGRQDIQTRTTLAAYCEKFGLDMPEAFAVDAVRVEAALGCDNIPQPAPRMSVREKLYAIQDLIDEVLQDLVG